MKLREFFWNCYYDIFGTDGHGIPCKIDSDCNGTQCLQSLGVCYIPYLQQEDQFLTVS